MWLLKVVLAGGVAVAAFGLTLITDDAGVCPDPTDTSNNAFRSAGLLQPPSVGSRELSLADTLEAFANRTGQDLCYWSFQPLPPPHPKPKYWNGMLDGDFDEDVEWEHALVEVAVSRLHAKVRPGGPVVGAACTNGRDLLTRRCANGKADASECRAPDLNESLRWPMAVAIFKVGHPDLKPTIRAWRSRTQEHAPNIQWAFAGGSQPFKPWSGPQPRPGDVNPPGFPQGPELPVSKGMYWGVAAGQAMLAKVVPCDQIPAKFYYHQENYYCGRLSDDESRSVADEAYATWRSLVGVWPPTKPCVDDLDMLRRGLNVSTCIEAKTLLEQSIPNFGCDTIGEPMFNEICCSLCGGRPIPDLTPAPPPVPTPPPTEETWTCSVCSHTYSPETDGDSAAFEDLPESWRCPVCGAPKSAYHRSTKADVEGLVV